MAVIRDAAGYSATDARTESVRGYEVRVSGEASVLAVLTFV
jgi:hypothetical protein